MISKRLRNRITARAGEALADAKSSASEMDIGRKAKNAEESAVSKLASTDAVRRRVQDKALAAGENLFRGRGASAEISAVAHTLESVVSNVGYADLTSSLQTKFKVAGLGGERGFRTAAEAQSFYDASVPDSMKMLGEDAVREFLKGKDASHIRSFENAPKLAKADSNFVWEAASANRARGAADMTGWEQIQINLGTGFESFAMVAKEVIPQATLYAVAIEGSISIIENSIYVYRGQKDIETALQDTARNAAKSAVVGLVAGTVIAGASAAGAAPLIAAAAPVLGVVGGALLVYSAANRINTALTYEASFEQGLVIDSYVV
ncbi:MAG: hypothetical protein OXH22_06270, partial [Chloroflexi bacterium]|nr:hypothetical protein [Chloroflexota bacterium]